MHTHRENTLAGNDPLKGAYSVAFLHSTVSSIPAELTESSMLAEL
jgi:hypothetical protein